MNCNLVKHPMIIRTTELFYCSWKDPENLRSSGSLGFYCTTDKSSCFSLTTSEGATAAEKIWKLWEDAVEQECSAFRVHGPQSVQRQKEGFEKYNVISGKTIWLQNLPIYEQKSAHKLNFENIEKFNITILKNYKIEQVYVNPKSQLGCLLIENELYFATGKESKKPQLDFESQQFITTLGKLNDIVAKTIPKEKVPKEKKDTPDTSKQSLWRRFSSVPAGRFLRAMANKILHPSRNAKVLASSFMIISLCAILFRYSPRKMTHF